MKICIYNTVVKFGPSSKTFHENLYRGVILLTLEAPWLIRLLNFSLQSWLLQCNYKTPEVHLICTKMISTKGLYKQKNLLKGICGQ